MNKKYYKQIFYKDWLLKAMTLCMIYLGTFDSLTWEKGYPSVKSETDHFRSTIYCSVIYELDDDGFVIDTPLGEPIACQNVFDKEDIVYVENTYEGSIFRVRYEHDDIVEQTRFQDIEVKDMKVALGKKIFGSED